MTGRLTRRETLGFVGTCGLNLLIRTKAHAVDNPIFLSSRQSDGSHQAVLFTANGSLVATFALPARAHGGAFSPINRDAVVFARRPERFAIVVDKVSGQIRSSLTPPDNRHFYGHGCFSSDGRLLFASENDFDSGRGVISVWDVKNNYKRLAEFESHGVGPHEIIMLSDDKTLVIANGGIETHPDTGRMKLNLFDMQPNLTWLDARTGHKIRKIELPSELHKLSIRHLAANRAGTIAVGLQYQGSDGQMPPLAFTVEGKGLNWLKTSQSTHEKMTNYCGSVSIDASGKIAAISHPRGSLITFWSIENNRFLKSIKLDDGCGVAALPHAGGFILSGGTGTLVHYNVLSGRYRKINTDRQIKWDNHISAS